MGRTLPTFRLVIERLCGEWSTFRRALRTKERKAFDSMMNKARLHASSASFMVDNDPLEVVMMAILVEQEKELMDLKALKESVPRKDPPALRTGPR